MPFDKKEYMKEYNKKYKETRKDLTKEYNKKYRQKNKDILKQKRQTEKGKKIGRINGWKHRGVIFFDYDLLYDIYISTTHCDNCNCILTTDHWCTHTTRCLDHNHETGEPRNILCNLCNIKRK